MQGRDRKARLGRAQRATNTRITRRVGLGSLKISIQAAPCTSPAATAPIPEEQPTLPGLLEGFCAEPRQDQQLAVNAGGRLLFLRLADISLLQGRPDGVAVYVGKQTHILSESLGALTARLPRGLFVRVSPRLLVNTLKVKNLRRLCQGEWQVVLSQGARPTPCSNPRHGETPADSSKPRIMVAER
jgi:DNA-binding LytR/AlgR family response regulator